MEQKPFFPKYSYNKPAIINKEIYLFIHSLLKIIFIERKLKRMINLMIIWISG